MHTKTENYNIGTKFSHIYAHIRSTEIYSRQTAHFFGALITCLFICKIIGFHHDHYIISNCGIYIDIAVCVYFQHTQLLSLVEVLALGVISKLMLFESLISKGHIYIILDMALIDNMNGLII